jgi:hypothetical protein
MSTKYVCDWKNVTTWNKGTILAVSGQYNMYSQYMDFKDNTHTRKAQIAWFFILDILNQVFYKDGSCFKGISL